MTGEAASNHIMWRLFWCCPALGRRAARAMGYVTERHTHRVPGSADPLLLQSWLGHLPFPLLLSISWHTHLLRRMGAWETTHVTNQLQIC